MPSCQITALLLIATSQITIGQFSSCIPKEYRGVRREVWKGLGGGWYLSHLTSSLRFPDKPTITETISTFAPPRNYGEYYGQRLQAYFIPPASGNYTFHATCDSECALYLSSDETSENKKEIIRIHQAHKTRYHQWNGFPQQTSCPQELEQGKFYYLEALHSNYKNDDHVRIHIQIPGSTAARPLDREFMFLYSPGYSAQSTCLVLRKCGVTCGGGLSTHIRTNNGSQTEVCAVEHGRTHSEPLSLHVRALNITPSSTIVTWKSLGGKAGVFDVLSYKVQLRSKEDVRMKTVNTSFESVLFEQLSSFTNYCIIVEPVTILKGNGMEECYNITTHDDVPSFPPQNITTTALGNTSFSVSWQPVPLDHVNGIVLGYKIFYEDIRDSSSSYSKSVNSTDNHVQIIGLSAAARFCVKVLAFTRLGDGPNSSCVDGWTWSDEILFPVLKAWKNGGPTTITITWDAPPNRVLRELTHYHLTYTQISETGAAVVNATSYERNVSIDSLHVTLNDLATYSTYKIVVRPVLSHSKWEEIKVLFAETCRCPHLLLASWKPSPPYVITDSSNQPRGLLPQILARFVQDSCGNCSGKETWNISYIQNTTKSVNEADNRPYNMDFHFPVRRAIGKTTYRGHSYVPLITVPTVAVMTRKKTPSAYAQDLSNSIIGCWPIFAISFVMAILTGFLVWFAESEINSEQFFAYKFHKGVVEGIWWSLVTMTTVGYGDRYPRTIVGRSIAIVWFLIGILLSSLLISSITSSLSIRILDEKLHLARGKKVASLPHFPESDLLIRVMSTAGESRTYSTLEELVSALKYGEVDGILVDVYTAHYRDDLFNTSWIQVSHIIPFEFTSGAVISRSAAKLERHFRDLIVNKRTEVTKILQETNEDKEKNTLVEPERSEKMPILDPSTAVYHLAVILLTAFLCLAVMIGLVYHAWYKKQQKWRYDIEITRLKEREQYLTTKAELNVMVQEFHQRFVSTYKRMRTKHIKQLQQLKGSARINGSIPNKMHVGDWV